MKLFRHARQKQIESESPLANRMRPRTLDEFVGQEHIVGPGRLLRRAIEADQLSSLIFYGPPGTGKTTLAMVIANTTSSHFITINAVLAGVKQIREAIAAADERRTLHNQRTTLFVDEVHRWNKAQQDALLPHVERGTILLVGATTENPYFEVNRALVSRSRIFQLKPLTAAHLHRIVEQTLADEARGYGRKAIHLEPDARDHLVDVANGDARSLLNALELAVETTPPDDDGRLHISLSVAEESIQQRAVLYDKDGDAHYDTISAFIKSLRGSDPDAALYWLAKMVYAGEDARFLFRRMGIFAGEDVGLADPQAAAVVNACWDLYEKIGMPEGQFPLAEAALYLATAPKSNSVFAFFDALEAVRTEAEADVPNHLKDGSRDKDGFGHGRGYLYPHAYRDHWVAQQYLPDGLQGRTFYQPGDQGAEAAIRTAVARRREAQLAAMLAQETETEPEMFTTSPTDHGREAWLRRTVSQTGQALADLRERLFALAQVRRHHVVLDAAAGTGLLTWEAIRQTPEGGVWALTTAAEAAEGLRQQAAGLPELDRPTVVTDVSEIDSAVRFDRILSRNAFTRRTDWENAARLAARLRPDGRWVVAQVVPRRGQRPANLIDWSGAEKLGTAVRAAETGIYENEADDLVNWDVDDLITALTTAGLTVETAEIRTVETKRQITADRLDGWFEAETAAGRPSYQTHLQATLTADDVARVERRYRRQLAGRVAAWRTAVWVGVLTVEGKGV